MIEYYCTLMVKDRAKTKCDKYASFQIHWLQIIQAMVSYGECRATDEGQVDDESLTKEDLAIADELHYCRLLTDYQKKMTSYYCSSKQLPDKYFTTNSPE